METEANALQILVCLSLRRAANVFMALALPSVFLTYDWTLIQGYATTLDSGTLPAPSFISQVWKTDA